MRLCKCPKCGKVTHYGVMVLSEIGQLIECIDCHTAPLRAKLSDWEESSAKVLSESCAPDERHCTCVPFLRSRVAELETQLEAISEGMDEIYYPKHDGTREWIGAISSYLRGEAMAVISLTPEAMKRLEDVSKKAGGE